MLSSGAGEPRKAKFEQEPKAGRCWLVALAAAALLGGAVGCTKGVPHYARVEIGAGLDGGGSMSGPDAADAALASCDDQQSNGGESDVDCGGPCAPCSAGRSCAAGGDCASRLCVERRCTVASCTDLVRNGGESDVDCGGPTSGCPACGAGKTCAQAGDCIDASCSGGLCQSASCGDGIENGAESDLDCGGGSGCSPCASGQRCHLAGDCASGICAGMGPDGICQPPSCTDGIRNGAETDTDCGGTCAPVSRCAVGARCATGSDCATASCSPGGICLGSSCGDGIRNGDESDTDCGGSCPLACGPGQSCGSVASNCADGICTLGICQTASCGDTARNGRETDVDCRPCADGKGCLVAADCTSQVCAGGLCQAALCTDLVANGPETDVDCGGTCPMKCGTARKCRVAVDCVDGVCMTGTCAAPTCRDMLRNGLETDVDCGGGCPACPNGKACAVAADCASGVCPPATHVCAAPSCQDGVRNGGETDVDCGGTCAPQFRCPDGKLCSVSNDCADANCLAGACTAGGCQTCWKVSYSFLSIDQGGLWSAERLLISAVGAVSVPLSELTIRYWFSSDGRSDEAPSCFTFALSCVNLQARIVPVTPARPLADRYLEIAFTSQAGVLAAGTTTGAMDLAFHESGWTMPNLADDYSCDPTVATLRDWPKVTLYHNGFLVWGSEP